MSGSTFPRVSVIMPTRNAGRYLDAAINSIRTQSLSDLELIVVDDGSTDGSDRVLREHAAADPRVSVLRLPHMGVANALNAGLAVARAALIARMDADDEAKPERIERQAAFLEARPEIAVLGTGAELVDADGRVLAIMAPITEPARVRESLLRSNALMHPSVMMRRDAVLAVGGYRPIFTVAEDYDLWLRLSERHDLGNLPDCLLRYRSHGAQATGRGRRLRPLEVLALLRSAELRRSGQPDPMSSYSRIDAATLRAIGVPRSAILAALDGRDVPLEPFPPDRLSGVLRAARKFITARHPG